MLKLLETILLLKIRRSLGFSVREVGENFAKGDKLISKGTKIDYTHIGVMASLNIDLLLYMRDQEYQFYLLEVNF